MSSTHHGYFYTKTQAQGSHSFTKTKPGKQAAIGRRSNKQNGPKEEWVQEQKNKKLLTYMGLYGLIDKTIIRIVKNIKKTNKLCMN